MLQALTVASSNRHTHRCSVRRGSRPYGDRETTGAVQFSLLTFPRFLMLTSARPPTRAWEVARTVVAPPLSVVNCLWEVFVWGSCRARVCAGVGGVFSVGVSCVRVTC